MPTLKLDPISGDNYINASEYNSSLEFDGTTTDIANDTPVTVTVYKGSDATGQVLIPPNSDALVEANGFQYPLPAGGLSQLGVPDGTYFVTASATDPNTGSAQDSETVTVDTHAPTLTAGSVTTSTGSQTLHVGDMVQFNVGSTEPVTVNGTPTLTLNDGGVATFDSSASTADPSHSGFTNLVFDYTVQQGENASDLKADGSSLPDSVTDLAGNPASAGVSFDTQDVVDTTNTGSGAGTQAAPSISINSVTGDNIVNAAESQQGLTITGSTTGAVGQTVTFTIHAGSNASGPSLVPVPLTTTVKQDGSYTATIPSSISSQIPNGQYFLTADVANSTGSAEAGEPVTVDKTIPNLTGASATPSTSGTLKAGDAVVFTVNSDKPVTVSGTPTLQLNDGETATLVSPTGPTSVLQFVYTVQSGDNTSDLMSTGLNLNGGTIADSSGNNAAVGNVALDTHIAVNGAPTPSDTTPPTITFGSGHQDIQTFNTIAVLNGTVSDNVGVKGVEVFGSVNGATVSDLGSATVNSDGSWTFGKDFGPGQTTLSFLSAVATDTSGNMTTANNSVDVTLGVTGQVYTDVVDYYTPDGNYTGKSSFFDSDDNRVYNTDTSTLVNGDTATKTSGGYFFNGLPYSSYTDTTSSDGQLLQETVHYKDGSNTIQAEADGQTLRSIKNEPDTLFSEIPGQDGSYFANTHYVYSVGSGHDTIDHFQLTGVNHDVLTLPASEAGNLASIIASSHSVQGGVELDFNAHDSLVLGGVTATQLRNELKKEVISGNTTDFKLA